VRTWYAVIKIWEGLQHTSTLGLANNKAWVNVAHTLACLINIRYVDYSYLFGPNDREDRRNESSETLPNNAEDKPC